jgi:integrase/recombinase XerC
MKPLELQEALTKFLAHLTVNNFSPCTIRTYHKSLARLILFVGERLAADGNPSVPPICGTDALTPPLLQEWLDQLSDESISRLTVVSHCSAVRSWCKWLARRGHLDSNPAAGLRGPRVGKALPFVLSETDVFRLLRTPIGDEWKAVRSRAIMHTLYSTACRAAELVGLNLADVNGRTALVRGKGHKERVVVLGGAAQAALQEWAPHRLRLLGARQEPALFVNGHGGRLGTRSLDRLFANLVRVAGLDQRTTVHTMRHSAATHLADRGCDLRIVSALLGHTSMKATEVYLHTSVRRLQTVHQQTHPLT